MLPSLNFLLPPMLSLLRLLRTLPRLPPPPLLRRPPLPQPLPLPPLPLMRATPGRTEPTCRAFGALGALLCLLRPPVQLLLELGVLPPDHRVQVAPGRGVGPLQLDSCGGHTVKQP
jgi:hypothetical protein